MVFGSIEHVSIMLYYMVKGFDLSVFLFYNISIPYSEGLYNIKCNKIRSTNVLLGTTRPGVTHSLKITTFFV